MLFSHTKYYKQDIPFEYTCEHCKKGSSIQIAEFRIGASLMFKGLKLSDKDKNKLTLNAQKAFKDGMVKYREEIERKHKFPEFFFQNKCPHCEKRQVWGKGHVGRNRFMCSLIFAGAGAISSFFFNQSGAFNLGLLIVMTLLGLFVGFIVGLFTLDLIQSLFPPRPKPEYTPKVHWPNEIQMVECPDRV